jgi:hypothetical protein
LPKVNFTVSSSSLLILIVQNPDHGVANYKKEAALLAPLELVSPCILAGEENVALREEEEEKVENALKIFFLLL